MVNISKSWYLKENNLSLSLLWLHVGIKLLDDNLFLLTVTDEERIERSFSLPTLEDCIEFTENYIYRCKNIKEVHDKYIQYSNEKYDKWNAKVSR